ncbi:protein ACCUMULATION AND REPLICATION OF CHLOROPLASTS 3 [Dorcoceras hygrometricum]|uniref:Protein ACCUMULATION AND REPLICATION OF CHLOROPLASTS 3 n=1 Tax=Dorcoceras hygrometricum TaxID=472368 RepID=A0A2Z7BHD6_9LAMI|nr:protein ACCUMULATION AND REPLICATION OF CHLOROPLASTS 3 [Dorcoceras hygrometricum]
MTLFYPTSAGYQSLLRLSSLPSAPVPRNRNNLFLGAQANSIRVELSGSSSNGGIGKVTDTWEEPCESVEVIVVASAAYGSEHIIALNVLSNIKAENGLVVGIILKPFSFEGQRRQNEVPNFFLSDINDTGARINWQDSNAVKFLHCSFMCPFASISLWSRSLFVQPLGTDDHSPPSFEPRPSHTHQLRLDLSPNHNVLREVGSDTNFLDTDALLENELVTLDEALRTSNNTVLMAMNAISVIISIVERYNKTRFGFGAGYNVRTSLLRSINDCPFLGVDLKDFGGVILCIFASSDITVCGDATTIFQTVRLTIGWNSEIVVSIVHESNLEPNVILTTVIAFGDTKQRLAPKKGIFANLGRHFPFIFDIFKKKIQQSGVSTEKAYLSTNSDDSDMVNSDEEFSFTSFLLSSKLKFIVILKNDLDKMVWVPDDRISFLLLLHDYRSLESERDSEKKWNRVVEMKYRGGIYKGRIHGGLPEGKGRLLLHDGSVYDGMWRYGKKSGLGTLCFNNGDVYQGSWRDDVMHGKGWFYFHSGDRWFVNFWKGKANGEGRFYSKIGDVFFGQFKEGWRHGHFLHINVDGTRTQEVWDEGVLVSNEHLDAEAGDG